MVAAAVCNSPDVPATLSTRPAADASKPPIAASIRCWRADFPAASRASAARMASRSLSPLRKVSIAREMTPTSSMRARLGMSNAVSPALSRAKAFEISRNGRAM